MSYVYQSPVELGYMRVKVTRHQHREIFRVRKFKPWSTAAYYYNGETVIVEHLTAGWFVALMILPCLLICPFLMGLPQTYRDLKRVIWQRKSGSFSSDSWCINPEKHDPDEQPIVDAWLKNHK